MALRILNEMGEGARARIHAALPDAEVITVGAEAPAPGTRADVFFGGYGPHSLELAACVPWVQLSGTGVDKVPREMYDGRTVTCARGASAIPISEFVLAAMLAFEKRMPEVWLDEPPEHWNFAKLGGLDGQVLGLVGLGGIGSGRRRASDAVRHARARHAPNRSAEPASRCGGAVRRSTISSRPRTTSCSPHPRPSAPATCSMCRRSRRSSPVCTW